MPSPIAICADIAKAIQIEKSMLKTGGRGTLRDLLSKVVAEYNRLTTVKKHRIDSGRRSLIYNLFLGQENSKNKHFFIIDDHF